jgi:hypothetical protein
MQARRMTEQFSALEPRMAWKLSNVVLSVTEQAGGSSLGVLVTPVFSTNYGSLDGGLDRRPVNNKCTGAFLD